MKFNKAGLYQDKNLYPDIMLKHYKPYQISQEDLKKSYEKFDISLVETNKTLKILNGSLFLDKEELDITNKTLRETLSWLSNKDVVVTTFNGFDTILDLPAILLVESSNVLVSTVDADISPLDLNYMEREFTVNSLSSRILSSVYVSKGQSKVLTPTNTRLFFEPVLGGKIHTVFISTKFYLQVDFSPKRSKNNSITELLNYGESNV